MKLLTTAPTEDGYVFYLDGELVAIGSYVKSGFILIETDDTTSRHDNGMRAMAHLRRKHMPEFYNKPVNPAYDIKPRTADEPRSSFDKFKSHPLLQGVNPIAEYQ